MPTLPPPAAAWSALQYGMFLHFGPNTFAGVGWGDGKFPASGFAPTALDTDQWAATAAEAGMKYAVLTTKHHDGFCLWPTAQTEYCVRNSPGHPDVVGRFVESCRKHGIAPGFYYSLWDRNCPVYDADAAYADFMLAQLRELLTQYGPIVELWFDGGWDKDHPTRTWQWDDTFLTTVDPAILAGGRWRWADLYAEIHRLMPAAMVTNNSSSDRPGGVKLWPIDFRTAEHFDFVWRDRLCEPVTETLHSDPTGRQVYLPLEFSTSLNPDWFYVPGKGYPHPSAQTVASWRARARAVGANFLLNVGPDTAGRIPDVHRHVLRQAAALTH